MAKKQESNKEPIEKQLGTTADHLRSNHDAFMNPHDKLQVACSGELLHTDSRMQLSLPPKVMVMYWAYPASNASPLLSVPTKLLMLPCYPAS